MKLLVSLLTLVSLVLGIKKDAWRSKHEFIQPQRVLETCKSEKHFKIQLEENINYSNFTISDLEIGKEVILEGQFIVQLTSISIPLNMTGTKFNLLYPVKFFQFKVNEILPNQDLFIVLKALEDRSTYPALYLSKENKYPSYNNQNDVVCGVTGLDVCSIDPSQLAQNQTYYLGIYCAGKCKFRLKVHYFEEQVIDIDDAALFNFSASSEAQLFKVNIPKDINMMVDRLIIKAHLVRQINKEHNESFHFYVNYGNENPNPSSFNFLGDEIWNVGKGVVIHNSTIKDFHYNKCPFKAGDNFTVVLLAPPESLIYVATEYYTADRDIYLFEVIDDMVGPGEVNDYVLNIGRYYQMYLDKNSLSLDIHPYEGNPDVYISTSPRPSSLTDYRWQSQLDLGFESMSISPGHRNSSEDYVFYIAIQGKSDVASYSFIVYISDYQSRLLGTLATESGFITSGEVMQYQLQLYQEESKNFTIQANYPESYAYLIMKKCTKNETEVQNVIDEIAYQYNAGPENFYNCSITKDDIDLVEKTPILNQRTIKHGSSELIVSQSQIRFNYNSTNCVHNVSYFFFEEEYTRCAHVVGVVGKKDSTQSHIKYQLTLKGDEQHVQLFEGQSYKSFLLQYDIDYYEFHYPDIENDKAMEIAFQITVINGDVLVYGSRKNKHPNSTDHETFANMGLDVINYVRTDIRTKLNGTYYIAVQSTSTTRYLINAIVYRAEQINSKVFIVANYIELVEGQVQRQAFVLEHEEGLFTFRVQLGFNDSNMAGDEFDKSIFIHLNSIVGDFDAYLLATHDNQSVNAISNPSENNYYWHLSSNVRNLIIDEDDAHYVENGTYRIMVRNRNEGKGVFEIWYTTERSIIPLTIGAPSFQSLEKGQVQFYELYLQHNMEELYIIRSLETEVAEKDVDVELTISLDSQNMYPLTNYDQKLSGSNETHVKLGFGELQGCGVMPCMIYIAAKSIGGYNEYSILIRGKNEITHLMDGVMQELPLVRHSEYSYMYYVMPKDKTVTVQLSTYYEEMELFGTLVSYNDNYEVIQKIQDKLFVSEDQYREASTTFKQRFPNSQTASFTNYNVSSAGSRLMVVKSGSSPCSKEIYGCILLISIRISPNSWYAQFYNTSINQSLTEVNGMFGEDGFYSVVVSSDVQLLRSEEVQLGQVEWGVMTFYRFTVSRPVKVIELSVNPLDDGDPDIFVKFQGFNTTEIYPTLSDYDFYSSAYKADNLVILGTNDKFQNKQNQGTYIVGIQGFSKCSFQIELNLADIELYTLTPGQILSNIEIDGTIYMKYNHVSRSSLRLIVLNGQVQVGVATQMNGYYASGIKGQFLDSLPYYQGQRNNISWELLPSNELFGNMIYISTEDAKYCGYCTYLIGIQSTTQQQLSIVMATEYMALQLQPGISIFDYATDHGNYYQYQTNNSTSTRLMVTLYSGMLSIYTNIGAKPSAQLYKSLYEMSQPASQELVINGSNTTAYVWIKPLTTANYSISTLSTNDVTKRQLQIGKTVADMIMPKSNHTFYYISQREKQLYTLYISYSSNQSDMTLKFPTISTFFDPNNIHMPDVTITPTQAISNNGFDQLTYDLSRQDGTYFFTISNDDPSVSFKYNIVLNLNYTNFLLPNRAIMSKALEGDPRATVYDIYGDKDHQLYLELFQCIGYVGITFTLDNPAQIISEKPFVYNHVFKKDGDLFFAIYAIQGILHKLDKDHELKEALYLTVPHVIPAAATPPAKTWMIPKTFTTSFIDKNYMLLQVPPAVCKADDCTLANLNPLHIVYQLHLTNSEQYLNAFSGCNLPIESVKHFVNDEMPSSKIFHQKYFKMFTFANHNKKISQNQTVNIQINLADVYQYPELSGQIVAQVYYDLNSDPFTFLYDRLLLNTTRPINTTNTSDTTTSQPVDEGKTERQQMPPGSDMEDEDTITSKKNGTQVIQNYAKIYLQSTNKKQQNQSLYDQIVGIKNSPNLPYYIGGGALGLIFIAFVSRWCCIRCQKKKLKYVSAKGKYQDDVEEKPSE